jgi:hypothetical protein
MVKQYIKVIALFSVILPQCLLASADSPNKIADNSKAADGGAINGIAPATAVGFGLIGGAILIRALDASSNKITDDNNSPVVVTTTTGTTTTGTTTTGTTTTGTTTTGTASTGT